MSLASGSRLGPYEIVSLLGAGGMGEVYRARDSRLGREVAVKVLPASFSNDADRLRRFEQEARAAGLLNHPNITAVYDIGTHESAPYVVSELLEGETLRSALAGGRFSTRRTIDYATQIAQGLAAAHEKGIVHRDLKPENVFVTKDGRVKILDFGLAKLTHAEEGASSGQTSLPTATAGTEPGVVLGTLGYMAPEQVRGRTADGRSDIFSFGAILYEMLSGKRAFHGDSAADTMSAILREDPPDLSATNQSISAGLERIVRHCLEKNPEQRFQSARDLAFNLGAVSTESAPLSAPASSFRPLARRSVRIAPFAAALLAAGILGAFVARRLSQPPPTPDFRQLTFRRGTIGSARFAPDGKTVVYAAAWEGRPWELYAAQPDSPESRALGIAAHVIDSVSATGELAFRHRPSPGAPSILARAPLGGGAASREVLDEVGGAAWAPDGALAVVHRAGAKTRLEWPVGKAIAETATGFTSLRVSPDGKLLAFFEGRRAVPVKLTTIDRAGKRTAVAEVLWPSGLAWHPAGSELWVTSSVAGKGATDLAAFTLAGRRRLVNRLPGSFALEDISPAGDLLLSQNILRGVVLARGPGDAKETDLSWLDNSHVYDVVADGRTVLVQEIGVGGGPRSAFYLRKTDGSPAVKLGEGIGMSFSPDGRWVLSAPRTGQLPLTLVPTGPGSIRMLPPGKLTFLGGADITPDGKRIILFGSEDSGASRLYVQEISGGDPRAITPVGYRLSWGHGVSPDGKLVAAIEDAADRVVLVPIEGGEIRPLPGLSLGEIPLRWSVDGASLFVYRRNEMPARLFRMDLATGRRTLWKEISPADPTGVAPYDGIFLNADASAYAYCFRRELTDLYLVRGIQ